MTRSEGSRADGDAASLAALPLHEAARLVRARGVSPVDLTEACLARIERLQPPLNAFITVTAEVARGLWRGPLHGIPIALKDLVDSAGVRTTVASGLFAEHVPEAMPRWCGGCERQAPCYMADIREDARRTLDNGEERPLARGQNESAWSQKLFRSHHSRA